MEYYMCWYSFSGRTSWIWVAGCLLFELHWCSLFFAPLFPFPFPFLFCFALFCFVLFVVWKCKCSDFRQTSSNVGTCCARCASRSFAISLRFGPTQKPKVGCAFPHPQGLLLAVGLGIDLSSWGQKTVLHKAKAKAKAKAKHQPVSTVSSALGAEKSTLRRTFKKQFLTLNWNWNWNWKEKRRTTIAVLEQQQQQQQQQQTDRNHNPNPNHKRSRLRLRI